MARRLKVKPIDGELGLRYHVESRSHPDTPNIVDLTSYGGWGMCFCEHWLYNIEKIVKNQSEERLTRKSTCAHVRAAFRYFSLHALDGMIKHHGQEDQ